MYIALLGRQPELSIAELEAVFGPRAVKQTSGEAALVDTDSFNLDILGGTLKCAEVVTIQTAARDDTSSLLAASKFILHEYPKKWHSAEGKITLGISAYGLKVNPRDVQKTGLILKSSLKKVGVSLRLIPSQDTALSTATSHNNKLGLTDRKIELIIIRTNDNRIVIAESRGTQNITSYTKRDRERPKRDAFVGMLPPKLAQIMLNLALGDLRKRAPGAGEPHVLDPFCGTGVILQEALLRGYFAHGSDLSQKMVEYTRENLSWLKSNFRLANGTIMTIREADAMNFKWVEAGMLDAVVCETYLGQPFSAPPSPKKLQEVVGNCDNIISQFLKNIHQQVPAGTKFCVAIPAWRMVDGRFTHLPLTNKISQLGYKNLTNDLLLYHREDQVVARQLLVLESA